MQAIHLHIPVKCLGVAKLPLGLFTCLEQSPHCSPLPLYIHPELLIEVFSAKLNHVVDEIIPTQTRVPSCSDYVNESIFDG